LSEALPAPVIGISAYQEQARWGAWDLGAVVLPQAYAAQVAAAGGLPVLLPPEAGIGAVVSRLDGLILSGGGDVDPASYGADPHPQTGGVRPARDTAERALFAAAVDRGLPILGICRGLQVINTYLGGTLHQHLPEVTGHQDHSPARGQYGMHAVRVDPASRLAAVLGRTALEGEPSAHHQAIDRLGKGLTAVAWAPDGIIEAVDIDAPGCPFALAVQWHPEAGSDPSLFRALVAAARPAPLFTS
jgi:putative glutamine amidotransferase